MESNKIKTIIYTVLTVSIVLNVVLGILYTSAQKTMKRDAIESAIYVLEQTGTRYEYEEYIKILEDQLELKSRIALALMNGEVNSAERTFKELEVNIAQLNDFKKTAKMLQFQN